MRNQIDHIVEHLFQKERLEDVSVYELERFIATYPYFAAGHFLLAKKNQITDPQHFKEKVAKAALYYHNPLWLQWLLDQDLNSTSKTQQAIEPVVHEDTVVPKQEFGDTVIVKTPQGEKVVEQPFENAENENVSHFYSPDSSSQEVSQPSPILSSETSLDTDTTQHFPEHTATQAANENFNIQPQIDLASQTDFNESDSAKSNEPAQHLETVDAENSESVADLKVVSDPDDTELPPVEDDEFRAVELQEKSEIPNHIDQTERSKLEEMESRASAASIERTLSGATLIPTKAEVEKNEFTFEPYHTIDYFASQGIKLQQSDLSKDKFGKQLKSFTEWLRSMKRLPQAATEGTMDDATQRSIQHIAEHSFEEKDIVTETMAEVWIKQGNKEKAIDTLNKLSLLNPSKSHYFAAKIEQLKAS